MKVQVQKWGNSLAVRLPSSFAVEMGIQQGATVEISVEDEAIVLRPTLRELSLEHLLAGVTAENLHHEIDFGKPR